MCTSFVFRKNDNVLIGMNFDNNGMPFSIKKDDAQFVVLVDGGRGKWPSFGVNSKGTFINNLTVDSNGKGLYKRASTKTSHTSKFTGDILNGAIQSDKINSYLEDVEIVNSPDNSVHNMIIDKDGNVNIVEPGRGIINSKASENPFFVMTNFSLCDYQKTGELKGCGADRYFKAKQLLENMNELDIAEMFKILDQVKQSEGEWRTVFSLVYSVKENTVYYCYNCNFSMPDKFTFI